jgi:hypothetical protein
MRVARTLFAIWSPLRATREEKESKNNKKAVAKDINQEKKPAAHLRMTL